VNPSVTTRRRLTLVDLERDVSSAGGGKVAPTRRASAAALSADVLSQIDMLRGRSQRSRKRGVAALLDVRPRQAPTASGSTAVAYDVGAPVHVGGSASSVFGQSFSADAGSWRSFAYRTDDDPTTTGFAVEVFEEESRVLPPAAAVPTPTRTPETAVVTAPPTAAPAVPAPDQTEVPIAAALSAGQREDGFLGLDLSAAAASDREDAEQFEREIQAILSGQTTRPAAQSAASSLPAGSAPVPVPAARPHDIFEQMGQNMAYATAFNLPPMELGRRLDELERDITREEQTQARPPGEVSLELTDADISESLGLGRTIQNVMPPIAVLPLTPAPEEVSQVSAPPATEPAQAMLPVTAPAVVPPVAVTAPEPTPLPSSTPGPAPATGAPAPGIAPTVTEAIQPAQNGRAKP
jgi:hypothetical protein